MSGSLPYKIGRRFLKGELTLDQAFALRDGGQEERGLREVAKARQRESRGEDGLNQTERRYRDEVLTLKKIGGYIKDFVMPCPIKLKVGPTWSSTFLPDALVILGNGELELVDVKAGMRVQRKDGSIGHRPLSQDDARAKIHAAAALFSYFRFTVAFPIPRKDGGGWREVPIE